MKKRTTNGNGRDMGIPQPSEIDSTYISTQQKLRNMGLSEVAKLWEAYERLKGLIAEELDITKQIQGIRAQSNLLDEILDHLLKAV